jgi:hypothetical protein
MISSDLQEKIREYGESLHVSQRGAFISASQYPKWKKKLFVFLLTKGKGVKSCETFKELLAVVNKENFSKQAGLLSDLREFLFLPISIPLVTLLMAPFFAEIVKRHVTWQSVPVEKIMAAIALGALLD